MQKNGEGSWRGGGAHKRDFTVFEFAIDKKDNEKLEIDHFCYIQCFSK